MKRVLKILGLVVGACLLLGAGAFAYAALRGPRAQPASTEAFAYTPERIARGKYLVEHVADCFTCHGDHQEDVWGRPAIEETKGKGGFPFDERYHVPGQVTAQNITPDKETGIGAWTDGEIIRAVREGIGRDGRALFPMMPYEFFKHMSDEDARSVVAYLRQLEPVKNTTPPRRLHFLWDKVIVKMIPEPVTRPIETPADSATDWQQHLKYGEYLVTVAGCVECHTPHDESGKRIKSMDFAGGYVLKGPWGTNTSANITPHEDTYVGKATKAEFIARFKAFAGVDLPKVEPGRNTFMPWLSFRDVTEQDLGAIYDYLKHVVKPIENEVDLAGIYQQPPPRPGAEPQAVKK
jgi:hypothetical protein